MRHRTWIINSYLPRCRSPTNNKKCTEHPWTLNYYEWALPRTFITLSSKGEWGTTTSELGVASTWNAKLKQSALGAPSHTKLTQCYPIEPLWSLGVLKKNPANQQLNWSCKSIFEGLSRFWHCQKHGNNIPDRLGYKPPTLYFSFGVS